MSRRTVVLTGASDGIGAQSARMLHQEDVSLVLVGRSQEKLMRVAEEVGADQAFVADFADLDQVRRLANDIAAVCPQIDVLANNAGGIFSGPVITTDGYERTFQVNHLAPFLLTNLLRDRLQASGASVVATSSIGARLFGKLNVNDLDSRTGFTPNRAYGNAKLANILFARELHRRWGDKVSAVAFHPGNVATSFATDTTSYFHWLYHTFLKVFLVSPESGGRALTRMITGQQGTDWQAGEFYGSTGRLLRTNKQAYDPDLAQLLWDRSAEMVGLQPNGS